MGRTGGRRLARGRVRVLAVALSLLLVGAGASKVHAGGPAATPRAGSRPNLLLITLDTVRADRLGVYGHGAAATPNIDRLAEQGVRFRQAVTTAPPTLPAHASIFTGQYPPRHGTRDNLNFRLSAGARTLAEVLASAGYATGGFVGAAVLHSRTGIAQGFDTYSEPDPGELGASPGHGYAVERRAEAVAGEGLDWIRGRQGPFFAWLHFFDAHHRYEPPSPYRERHADSPYDGEIAYVDAVLGELLRGLEAAGHADDTLVVLTADHGEGLGEHGELRHAYLVYQSTLHVPLVLWAPGRLPAGVVATGQASLADLLPTTLALLGVADPEAATRDGVDLGALIRDPSLAGRPAYAESLSPLLDFGWSELRAVASGGYKYVDAPGPELYDLRADPGERDNLIESEPARAADLRAELDGLAAGDDVSELGLGQAFVEPEALGRLRSLGYLGGGGGAGDATVDPKERIEVAESFEATSRSVDAAITAADWTTAEARLAELEALLPEHYLVPFYRGRTALLRGEPGAAARHLEGALALGPAYTLTHLELARAYRAAGRTDQAIHVLEEAVAGFPLIAAFPALLGSFHHQDGELDEAMRAYLAALELAPRHPDVLENLAHVHLARDEPEAAKRTLGRLVEAAPDDPDGWMALGVTRGRTGDLAGADAAIRRAIELAPGRADLPYLLGAIMLQHGRPERAADLFRDALAVDAGFQRARQALESLSASGMSEPEPGARGARRREEERHD